MNLITVSMNELIHSGQGFEIDQELAKTACLVVEAQMDKGKTNGRAGWHDEGQCSVDHLKHLLSLSMDRQDWDAVLTYGAMLRTREIGFIVKLPKPPARVLPLYRHKADGSLIYAGKIRTATVVNADAPREYRLEMVTGQEVYTTSGLITSKLPSELLGRIYMACSDGSEGTLPASTFPHEYEQFPTLR